MSDLRLIHSTIGSREKGLELAHTLVEENLVACVNVGSEVTSVYPWEKEIQQDREVPVTMKTSAHSLDETMGRIEELHPYDCPEILVTTVTEASGDYADWVHNYCG